MIKDEILKIESNIMLIIRERSEFIDLKNKRYPDGGVPRDLSINIGRRTCKINRLRKFVKELKGLECL